MREGKRGEELHVEEEGEEQEERGDGRMELKQESFSLSPRLGGWGGKRRSKDG